jgi:hypothetical protein
VGDGLSLIGNGLDVVEAAFGKSIPGLGLAIPAYSQAYKDYGKGFNDNQRFAHTSIVVLESAGTSYVTSVFVIGAVAVISGPPGWIVGGLTGAAVIIISERGFNKLNEKTFFPAADDLLR